MVCELVVEGEGEGAIGELTHFQECVMFYIIYGPSLQNTNRQVHGQIRDRTYSEYLQFDLALTHPRSGEPDCRSQL